MLNINFQVKVREPKDTSKLNIKERILCLCFMEDVQRGMSPTSVKIKYLSVAKTRKERFNMSKLFDKIYYNTSVGHGKEIRDNYEMIQKWDSFFGFNKMTQKDVTEL